MRAGPESLETAIGYVFADRAILRRALTHSSYVHEQSGMPANAALCHNEQLEFLGDSVLGFLLSDELVKRHPEDREGRLSKAKAHLASAVWLLEVSRGLALGDYLELGRGEELSGGRDKKTLLVDALEALIAAIYLDGGMDAARDFVKRFVVEPGIDSASTARLDAPQLSDYKSALQELAQTRRLPPPRYVILHERGPEHAKTFTVEVRIGRQWTGQADGNTKKSAAQQAARDVYQRLKAAPENGESA